MLSYTCQESSKASATQLNFSQFFEIILKSVLLAFRNWVKSIEYELWNFDEFYLEAHLSAADVKMEITVKKCKNVKNVKLHAEDDLTIKLASLQNIQKLFAEICNNNVLRL